MAADRQYVHHPVCHYRHLGLDTAHHQLEKLDRPINAVYATLISTALLIGFFYAGDLVLKLFSVDIRSFAVAGAMILFLMAIEMILDIELFKNNGPVRMLR